ncbi:MAG: hypothetical protein WC460_06105 [Patescibacteria group bacterium]
MQDRIKYLQMYTFNEKSTLSSVESLFDNGTESYTDKKIASAIRMYTGEYIQDLSLDISILKQRINSMENSLLSQKNIFIQNLPLERITLIQAIPLLLEEKDSHFVISSSDLDLYGEGDTEFDAIKDFSLCMEELYFDLKGERVEDLGTFPKFILDFLNKIVTEK